MCRHPERIKRIRLVDFVLVVFYPSTHNITTRPKPADTSAPPLLIPGNTTRLLGIVKPISSIAGADPRSDDTMGESQGL